MSLASLLAYMGILAIAAAAPGPGIAALVARVLGRGYAGAFAFTAGLAFGDLVWLTMSVVGLTVIAQTFQGLFLAIRWAGAAYLLYVAWKLWMAPVDATDIVALRRTESPWRVFLGGLAVTMGNPKVMVFYLALVPAFIDFAHLGLASYLELAVATELVLAGVFGAYVALAGKARGFFTNAKARRALNRATGGVMAGAAVAVVAS